MRAASIFISYRREDSATYALLICQYLQKEFGGKNVFIDVDMTAGSKFPEVLERRLAKCKVLLALIGPNWLNAKNDEGQRRLDDTGDWVRLEIARALNRDITVIPVCVGGAQLPKKKDLPEDIRSLLDHQAARVSTASFRNDMNGLARDIREIPNRLSPRHAGLNSNFRSWMNTSLLAAILVSGLIILYLKGTYLLDPLQQMYNRIFVGLSGQADITKLADKSKATRLPSAEPVQVPPTTNSPQAPTVTTKPPDQADITSPLDKIGPSTSPLDKIGPSAAETKAASTPSTNSRKPLSVEPKEAANEAANEAPTHSPPEWRFIKGVNECIFERAVGATERISLRFRKSNDRKPRFEATILIPRNEANTQERFFFWVPSKPFSLNPLPKTESSLYDCPEDRGYVCASVLKSNSETDIRQYVGTLSTEKYVSFSPISGLQYYKAINIPLDGLREAILSNACPAANVATYLPN